MVMHPELAFKRSNLRQIFDKCYAGLGGEKNKHVHWYLYERPKLVSRREFFKAATYAIWVAGLGADPVESFLERASRNGLPEDYQVFASWSDPELDIFMRKVHKGHVGPRAMGKWRAIHEIAKMVKDYPDEESFRKSFFEGKVKTKDLTGSDARALTERGLSFVGEATAQEIIKIMGGSTVKEDRWIKKFRDHYHLTAQQLGNGLFQLRIDEGLFDTVIWAYCQAIVRKVSKFDKHFDGNFDARTTPKLSRAEID